ncbi:MAG: EAL domain-containing protein [Cyanosarcina radialis HA8281-LM2]|jgi:EAL domain-containing protein (putative c-di-GMP-specific phosphodiesterase class I)/AmiR/NasT family two-component response regulator|nr:EAL domain-containing protein [Cyanosarcina radialis HA8281-LM2]
MAPQILIVEDELIAAENIARNLRKQGYEVVAIVDSGEAAILTAAKTNPDLVLMDIMLHGEIDGVVATEKIATHLQIPVIYMTAYADDATLERAKETNPYGYLTKPFKPQDLRTTIEIALQRHKTDKALEARYAARLCIAQEQLRELQSKEGETHGLSQLRSLDLSPDWELLATDLLSALERQEFQLHYQPQFNLKTGKVCGAESLLRWKHRERGFISPAIFIPLAEQTGSIQAIGEWVFQTAYQQIKSLYQMGYDRIPIAVNLSAYQFNQQDIYQQSIDCARRVGVPPQSIEIELTESKLVKDVEGAIWKLKSLKDLGIKIAIDDFGTGYSSLSYIQNLPFDILKIDQCFVRGIDRNIKNQAIVKATISMAHQLNLNVIAEGVETEAELDFLIQNNCNQCQGYLFSRPLTQVEFEKFLSDRMNDR